MKKYWGLYLVLALCFAKASYAQDYAALDSQFTTSTVLPNIHYGFSLYDLDHDKYIYGSKENQYFTPASNTKVYTLFSTIKHVGDSIPGIQYVIRGDSLLFWGTGDPTFLHPQLDSRKVYDFLKNTTKELFYVRQESAEPAYRNGWSIEDYQEDYQPDIATFPIYANVVRFVGRDSAIVTVPSYFQDYLRATEQKSHKLSISRAQHSNSFASTNSTVKPNYKTSKPFIWSDSLFVSLLQDTLHKQVNILTDYEKPYDIQTVCSVPRNVVLRAMMLPSDNFLAEQLTMVISSMKYNGFYTDSLRTAMQKEYYTNFQDPIVLRDGSGLSTYNKITPRNMVELLIAIEEAIPADEKRYLFFPAGGVDGTLKNAYTLDNGVPFVWAKTGTINSVHCQSGYLVTREGRRLAFSFLNNNYAVPTAAIRAEMVRIMTFIRENY